MRACLVAIAAAALMVAAPVSAGSGAVAPCAAAVHMNVLPVWMRGGFQGARPRVPYELGAHGAIAAILFGYPLHSPNAADRNNKILWVPRHPAKRVAPLWIRMQKMDGSTPVGAPVRRIVATGPGPSYVDATSAGCWRLTLTWSGQKDTLDLNYVTPPS